MNDEKTFHELDKIIELDKKMISIVYKLMTKYYVDNNVHKTINECDDEMSAMMNDFTKEELEEWIKWKYENCYKNPCDQKTIDPLVDKIQSMIDNYDKPCTHEYVRRFSFLNKESYDICPKCDYWSRVQ